MKAKLKCLLCDGKVAARRLCKTHYQEAYRAGTLEKYTTNEPMSRFEDKVEKTDGCWIWNGAVNHYGYGLVSVPGHNGRTLRAHRVAYERFTGEPIPPGRIILHTCDNPPCVNPDHLRLGTVKDNSHDMIGKGRGKGQFKAKLSEDDVREIRRLRPTHKLGQLSKMFGMGKAQICHICTGYSRSDVK